MSVVYGRILGIKIKKRKVFKMNTLEIREITLSNVSADEANLIVCVFCSDYASKMFCGNCNEYKGLMTLGEWLSYTQESWVM
jgi:predicted metal-binding protein